MHKYGWLIVAAIPTAFLIGIFCMPADATDEISPLTILDQGSDHVGQTFPEYMTGDECLFCHRRKIGPAWSANRHQLTIRPAHSDDPAMRKLLQSEQGADPAKETQLLLGSKRVTRFLKRSPDYGKLELLSASYRPHATNAQQHAELKNTSAVHWDSAIFADRCAGCHTTAVDAETGAFSAISLDCVTCHGNVDPAHTNDPGQVFLSAHNRDPHQVISTCGQCHLRGGRSKTTERPYPNTFVPGDNLFRDFEVELSEETIAALPTVEQHVYLNARDVILNGRTETTCLNCHDVHGQSSEKHAQLSKTSICATCHVTGSEDSELKEALLPKNLLEIHNRICDY